MPTHIANGLAHFDIHGPDAAQLTHFYAGVFDWAVESKGPGYALVETPGGSPNGAIVEAEQAALTIGLVVADLEASIASVADHGGAIIMPMTDNGWVKKAVVSDPAGNALTLIQA